MGISFKSTQHGSISLSLLLYGLGIASISDMKKLGRIGLRSLGLYLATTSVAIGIGLAFALFSVLERGVISKVLMQWILLRPDHLEG